MNRHGAFTALAGGFGLVALVVVGAVAAAVVLVALGLPAASRADDGPVAVPTAPREPRPTALVVGVQLGDPRLQAGVVRDGEVVLARGLEIDVVRALARRLRMTSVRFVPLDQPVSGPAEWDLAVTTVRPTRRLTVAGATVSAVYLPTGQVVVQRRGQRPLRRLGELRTLRLCGIRGGASARALAGFGALVHAPQRVSSDDRLFELVQTGVCDAALVDSTNAAGFVAGRRGLVGPITSRLDHGEGLAILVASGSGLRIGEVDRALRRLGADGTIGRLTRSWLRLDPRSLRALH